MGGSAVSVRAREFLRHDLAVQQSKAFADQPPANDGIEKGDAASPPGRQRPPHAHSYMPLKLISRAFD
jgi:hypothetical protein